MINERRQRLRQTSISAILIRQVRGESLIGQLKRGERADRYRCGPRGSTREIKEIGVRKEIARISTAADLGI